MKRIILFFQKFAGEVDNNLKGGTLNLIIYIESPKGLLNLREIMQTATKLSENGKILPSALVFGSDDFCASLGKFREM